jgi:hypothetical protein
MRTSSAPATPGISNTMRAMDGQRRNPSLDMRDLQCGEDTPLVPTRHKERIRSARNGLAAVLLLAGTPAAGAERFGARVVEVGEILQAMSESRGYELTATTNGPRFQSEVILRLVAAAEARDPARQPLFLGHREWFEAWRARTGLPRERAPQFVRLADQYGQDAIVDYRRDRVIGAAPAVNAPLRAANVCIWWPEREGGPESYSYEDLLATPHLKVTNERVISYRLLDYGDMVAFDEITGLRGRPTTGLLGMLFQLIGEGSVVASRIAVAPDGLQITRARAKKLLIEVATTVTVYPDGRTEKDLPPGRADLAGIEARLKQPLRLRHPAMECGGR